MNGIYTLPAGQPFSVTVDKRHASRLAPISMESPRINPGNLADYVNETFTAGVPIGPFTIPTATGGVLMRRAHPDAIFCAVRAAQTCTLLCSKTLPSPSGLMLNSARRHTTSATRRTSRIRTGIWPKVLISFSVTLLPQSRLRIVRSTWVALYFLVQEREADATPLPCTFPFV